MIDNAKRGNPFLKIALYAAAFNIILTPLTSIVAVFFGYIAIIAFILYPFTVKSVWLNFPIAVALIPIICILSCIQSASFFDINSIESYLLSLICLISFYLSISKENKNDMLTFNDMVNVSYMLSIAFIVYTFGGFDFSYQDLGSYGIKSFTMGLGNPNGVSLYVLFVIMVFLLKFSISKTKSKKVFYVILMLVMSYILIKLSSRTVILCAILAMLVLIFHKSKRFVKILVICACLISVLIIPFLIYQSNGMSEISILGKVLNTGRDVIYKDFLN
ncbi:MAG: hypothetical protein HFE94_08160, partial [Acutalibacter sp.]|nr:hypothetical protein [Acutalibacter sp.]